MGVVAQSMGVGPLLRQSSLAGHHLLATTVENANRWRRMVNFRVSANVVLVYFGEACEWTKCSTVAGKEDECQGRGTCKKETDQCMCNAPYKGAKCSEDGKECNSCIYQDCIGDCGGESNGQCDKVSGKCVCNSPATLSHSGEG